MSTERGDFRYFLSFLRRRKWQILIPMVLVLGMSAFAIAMLPASYRSVATVLIEEQEIPPELTRSAVSSYADQRIQVISQRLLARANLKRIIDKFGLTDKPAGAVASDALISKVRRSISLDMLSADVADRHGGSKSAATIAFVLSYEGRNPAQAQEVTTELVSLFLSENEKNRQHQTAEAARMLREEVRRLESQIMEMEERLAKFKALNADHLPELAQTNMQLRERAEIEMADADRQISSLLQRKSDLEVQLAQVRPGTLATSTVGDRLVDPEEQLRLALTQHARVSGIYSKDHPDIQRLEVEIGSLKNYLGKGNARDDQSRELARMRGDLRALQERYSTDHPDVMRLRIQISAIEESLSRSVPESAVAATIDSRADNPAYLTLRSQFGATQAELNNVRARKTTLRAKLYEYERRLSQTPQAERDYRELNRENEQALKRYQELKGKLVEAEMALQIEKGNLAERFSVLEPANLPEKPSSPNRAALTLLACILAMGAGIAFGGIREILDSGIHGADQLASLLPVPVMASIPMLPADTRRRWFR